VATIVICIVDFFVWPAITRYKTFEVAGQIENVEEGYRYAKNVIKNLTADEILLTDFSVGYRAADLEEELVPVYYEYRIQIVKPDEPEGGDADRYIAHMDLAKKQLTVVLQPDYFRLPDQQEVFILPNISEMLKVFHEKYGDEVLNEILEKDPEAILRITKPIAYSQGDTVKDWGIYFVSKEDILDKDFEPYWVGKYRNRDQRFLDKVGEDWL